MHLKQAKMLATVLHENMKLGDMNCTMVKKKLDLQKTYR